MIFQHVIHNTLGMGHEQLKKLLELYNVPVFPDVPNLRNVIYQHQLPFLQDLDEYVVLPMLNELSAISHFDDTDNVDMVSPDYEDENPYLDFGGKLKARKQAKKLNKQSVKQNLSGTGESKGLKARRLLKKQKTGQVSLSSAGSAEVLKSLPRKDRIKETLTAVEKMDKASNALGWAGLGANVLAQVIPNEKASNAFATIGGLASNTSVGLSNSNQNVQDLEYQDLGDGNTNPTPKINAKVANNITDAIVNNASEIPQEQQTEDKKDMMLYGGIAIVALIVLYLIFSKKKAG
jgi:hypothetical protein